MKRIISLLLPLMLIISLNWQTAFAQSGYVFSVGGRKLQQPDSQPYLSDGEVMVPVEELITVLGGLSAYLEGRDVFDFETEFGFEIIDNLGVSVNVLNDKVIAIVPSERIYMTMSVDQVNGFRDPDYNVVFDRMINGMLDGSISTVIIDFPYEKNGEKLFIPISKFAKLFDLNYTAAGQTIDFSDSFEPFLDSPKWELDTEQNINTDIPVKKQVTFQLDLSSKTYDGQPFAFSAGDLTVRCDGRIVTDYQRLNCIYAGLEDKIIQFDPDNDSLPSEAGVYVLKIETSPDDPQYEGSEQFPFQIMPAPITLRAKDQTITAGMEPSKLEYEIGGLRPEENMSTVMASEPELTVGNADIAIPGSYKIQISGGTTDQNHRITEYISGTLTVLASSRQDIVKIQCADGDGKILLETQKTDTIGKLLQIPAPSVAGYSLVGAASQQAVVGQTKKVTFVYRANQTSNSSNAGSSGRSGGSGSPNQSVSLGNHSVHLISANPRKNHAAYLSGYPDGSFRPRSQIARKECASMLYALAKQTGISSSISGRRFADVPQGHWYTDAVNALAGLGIINGYPDHTYRPDNPVTRVEFMVMAVKLAGIPVKENECSFYDIPDAYWAAGYIQAAADAGMVVGGEDGSFAPMRAITRAEAVTILNQAGGHANCKLDSPKKVFRDVPQNDWAYRQIMIAANDHDDS